MNMLTQNSYLEETGGRLYIIPTPIGNLEDMTFRAVRLLKEVDLIAAEDTRHTQKLLNHFEISNETISYHEHNRQERIPYLLEQLAAGKQMALVSDAGTPAISDPGYELVKEAIDNHYSVIVLPGASAAITALVGSGLSTEEFVFVGFLPRKKRDKEATLERLRSHRATIILYESPHRVIDTLQMVQSLYGERNVAIARELTKLYEQFIRGPISEAITWIKENKLRGECIIVIEGASEDALRSTSNWWDGLSIEQHVIHYEKEKQMSHKDAMRAVAKDRHISRRDVYQAIHVKK